MRIRKLERCDVVSNLSYGASNIVSSRTSRSAKGKFIERESTRADSTFLLPSSFLLLRLFLPVKPQCHLLLLLPLLFPLPPLAYAPPPTQIGVFTTLTNLYCLAFVSTGLTNLDSTFAAELGGVIPVPQTSMGGRGLLGCWVAGEFVRSSTVFFFGCYWGFRRLWLGWFSCLG